MFHLTEKQSNVINHTKVSMIKAPKLYLIKISQPFPENVLIRRIEKDYPNIGWTTKRITRILAFISYQFLLRLNNNFG